MVTATMGRAGVTARPTVPALYDAVVTHARRSPINNRFRHRTFYWLVDVDDPPRRRGAGRALARHETADHLDVRKLLDANGITAARILMLAHPRTLGGAFNPLSMYWCYDTAGATVALVAEVHNTYGGRHAYLLQPDENGRAQVAKQLYVSPFYPVDGDYEITVSEPGHRLTISIALHRGGATGFVASLSATRRPFTSRELLRATLRYPVVSARTAALIRWHGIRLWLRGLPVHAR